MSSVRVFNRQIYVNGKRIKVGGIGDVSLLWRFICWIVERPLFPPVAVQVSTNPAARSRGFARILMKVSPYDASALICVALPWP